MTFDDVSRRAQRLAEAEQAEREARELLELDQDADDPFLMLTWQRADDLRSRAREQYESSLTDFMDGDKGEQVR